MRRTKSICFWLALTMLAGIPAPAWAQQVRVLTFNLRYASAAAGANNWINTNQIPDRRQVVLQTITSDAPDIVGFQEGETSQLEWIADHVGTAYRMFIQGPSGGGGNENAAILVRTNRIAVLSTGFFSLGNQPGAGYTGNPSGGSFAPWDIFPENNFAFPRIAMRAEVEFLQTAQRFQFYTTHFDTFNGANNGESQWKSARMIVDDALERNRRSPMHPLAVVVGDFNGSQNDRAWKLFMGSLTNNGISGDFKDAWLEQYGNFTSSGTFHGFSGGVISGNSRIDWIISRGGFSPASVTIITNSVVATVLSPPGTRNQFPSDHYPVLAVMNMPAPKPDFDRDGIPDELELNSAISSPVDSDSDGDGFLDGEEDLDGNGTVESGETNPTASDFTQRPLSANAYAIDGTLDFNIPQAAANGLILYAQFDGRYLYLATQDAGEGSDHFIFLTTNPATAVSMPWAKSGTTAAWDAFLADENDNGFCGWFDHLGQTISNIATAQAKTWYTNGGHIEGLIDLSEIYHAGFTHHFYIAAAPYASADGGSLYTPAQVPAGNGDGDLVGGSEYHLFAGGDLDQDGLGDLADPDRDGDGLPNAWETAYGLESWSTLGTNGAQGDKDGDGLNNAAELFGGFDPDNPGSGLFFQSLENPGDTFSLRWTGLRGRGYRISAATGGLNQTGPVWTPGDVSTSSSGFPYVTLHATPVPAGTGATYRIEGL